MACDSLYGAWLKAHHPYEFYATMLKLYTEKGNKEKIGLIVAEMKRYQGIRMTPGRFGQDNRDWYIDKEHKTISQSLPSIKFMSAVAAEDLYKIGQQKFDSFTSLLRALQMETCLNSRQIDILIELNYFAEFGPVQALASVYEAFQNSSNRLTKSLKEKSVLSRMAALCEYEASLPSFSPDIMRLIRSESEYMNICLTSDEKLAEPAYFVEEIDDQYGIKIKLYNIRRGKSGFVKMRKDLMKEHPLSAGQIICLDKWKKQQRCAFKNGKRIPLDAEDIWITSYHEIKQKEV